MTNNPDQEKQPGQPGFIPPHGGYRGLQSYQMSEIVYDATYIENAPPTVAANTMLCLVHQTNYLLDQQLRQLEQAFLKDGGFTERLYQARQQARTVPPRPSFRRNRTTNAKTNTKPPSARPNPSYSSYSANAPIAPRKSGPPSPKPPRPPR